MTVSRIGVALICVDGNPADVYLDTDGNLAVVHDSEAVGQHARQRLMTHEGEWFLDREAGVPWLEEVMGRAYDPVLAEAVTKAELLDTDGVTDVTTFSTRFDRWTRDLQSYDITVTTEYDEEVQL